MLCNGDVIWFVWRKYVLMWSCIYQSGFESYLCWRPFVFLWHKFTMAAIEETVKVTVVTDRTLNIIPVRSSTLTAEELCIILCKKYKIPPLTRTLFALRVKGKDYFLKDNAKVLSSTRDYELRIRFKVSGTMYSCKL